MRVNSLNNPQRQAWDYTDEARLRGLFNKLGKSSLNVEAIRESPLHLGFNLKIKTRTLKGDSLRLA
jgi:hypothetical protein